MRDEQLPPKPNELESTWLMFFSRSSVVGTRSNSSILVLTYSVGNTIPARKAKMLYTAPIAAAAANVWPVKDLVELTSGTLSNILSHALPSERSLLAVAVP